MDRRDVTPAGVDPAAGEVIGRYLSDLDSHLPVGRRYRARIVAEVADGLACAVVEWVDAGAAPEVAARRVVAQFGDPRVLAAAFACQRGPVTAHRLGLGLVLTGPLVGLTWLAAYATGGVSGMLAAIPQLAVVLAVTVPAAMIAATGAGWAARWLGLPSRVVTAAALVAATGCVTGDLSLLSMAVLSHGRLSSAPAGLVVVAVAASLVRLSVAGWSGRRVARLRAAG